jgi:hypothetical protein
MPEAAILKDLEERSSSVDTRFLRKFPRGEHVETRQIRFVCTIFRVRLQFDCSRRQLLVLCMLAEINTELAAPFELPIVKHLLWKTKTITADSCLVLGTTEKLPNKDFCLILALFCRYLSSICS